MFAKFLAVSLLANMALAAPRLARANRRHPHTSPGAPFPTPSWPVPSSMSTAGPTGTGPGGPGSTGGSGGGSGAYTTYQGDGSIGAGWPDQSKWVSDFDTMWSKNLPTLQSSCTNLGTPPDNSATESQQVHDAINSIAGSSGIDPRFILAIMMQESKGCVRVRTTTGSHPNPGLMQSAGTNSCNNGTPNTPCPQTTIQGMISDGITGSGGLQQTMAKATGAGNGQKFYQAAYLYNSGIDQPIGNLASSASTACYASDIANRLTGFVGDSPCKL